jgi:hypothetical protein
MKASHTRLHKIKVFAGCAAVIALTVALAWNVWGAVAGSGSQPDPEDHLGPCGKFEDPEEAEACFDPYAQDYLAKQAAFRKEFAASGRDIHTLPIVQTSHQQIAITDPEQLLHESSVIVRGVIVSQSLGESPGTIDSVLKVSDVVKGQPVQEVIVRQVGGPVLAEDGPILRDSLVNPLVWLGREYILYLRDWGDGVYTTDSGNALYGIENGAIVSAGFSDWAKATNGLPVEEFVARLEQDVAAGTTAR